MVLPLLSASPVPFAKQVPNSIYSSYKNLSSFDHLISKQELILLIQKVSSFLFPRDQPRSQRLERDLITVYEKSLQSDPSLCNSIWSECLTTIAVVAGQRRGNGSPVPGDSDLISVQKELEALLNLHMNTRQSKSENEVIAGVVKLSQQYRLLIKKLPGEHLMQVAELFWKTAVLLYAQLQEVCSTRISTHTEELQHRLSQEEHRLNAHLKLLTAQWDLKLRESQQENTQLKSHLQRLRQDIAHCMNMVSERDEELQQLRDSGMYSELEKMLAEFVAGAGDDPGDPVLPKSMYGSIPVKGVKFTPTRFGSGDKPEPVLEVSTKETVPVSIPAPPPSVPPEHPPTPIETESDDSSSPPTLPPDPNPPQPYPEIHPFLPIQNIILSQLNKHPHIGHVLKPKDVYKLFENLLDAKFKLDKYNEEQDISPRSFPEFTLDYLYLINETKMMSLKHAAAVVKSVEKMRNDGDLYAGLFWRLMELGETEKCNVELGLFVVKVRMAVQELVLKGKKKIPKADMDVGGRISFSDTCDLIYTVFKEDREMGEAVLDRIPLPDTDNTDKSKLIFCGRLGKIGRDLKYFFVQADSQKNGSITFPVFSKTCRNTLEMNLSPENALLLWNSLTTSDTLAYSQVTALDFKGLSSKANGKQLSISKLTILTSVIDQYWQQREVDLQHLQSVFLKYDANGDGVLTLKEFAEVIESMESGLVTSAVVQIFREALELDESVANPDAMSPTAFCEVILKHQLGGIGKNVFQSKLQHLFVQAEEEEKTGKQRKKKGKKK